MSKQLKDTPSGKIENACNFELRHKSGVEPKDYLKNFLRVARQYGYATRDDSWGELEKELQIAFRRLETYKRFLNSQIDLRKTEGDNRPIDEIRDDLLAQGETFWENVQRFKQFDC